MAAILTVGAKASFQCKLQLESINEPVKQSNPRNDQERKEMSVF